MMPDMLDRLPRSIAVLFRAQYATFKTAERRAADLVIEYPDEVAAMTISQAAQRAGCSEPTFTRLARKLGYKGFVQMKNALSHTAEGRCAFAGIEAGDSPMQVLNKVFDSSCKILTDTLAVLDSGQYAGAAEAFAGAEHFFLAGVGPSQSVAQNAAFKLTRMGASCFYCDDQDAQLILASRLKPGDVCLLITHSGRTRSILTLAKAARERGAAVICITTFPGSPIVALSDFALITASYSERYREVTGNSLVQIALIESLLAYRIQRCAGMAAQLELADTAAEASRLA